MSALRVMVNNLLYKNLDTIFLGNEKKLSKY